jgi:lipopolysaccharide transport system permease protein
MWLLLAAHMSQAENNNEDWDLVIESKSHWLRLNLAEVWRYRDLLMLLVKRDYKASFKQTILGPIWFFIQPLLTSSVYAVIFGNIAKISTDGNPRLLFYMAGVIMWNYFSTCLTSTSNTFVTNANIFGKVYFPRLIMPVSVVISNLLRFSVQFLFFIALLFYFMNDPQYTVHLTWAVVFTPVFLVIMALLGLSMGLIVSSLTTKYRDLTHLVGFGVQLMMYATPVVYPASFLQGKWKTILELNPMTAVIEGFRFAFMGSGTFSPGMLLYSVGVTLVLLLISIIMFNRVEKGFMDTV